MISQSVRKFLLHITGFIKNFISSYFEVLRTGGIQSVATGEKVTIHFQANVCGDILIFIGPRNSTVHSEAEVIELALSDSTLKQKKELALESLRQKFQGLMVLPKMFAVFISIFLSFLVYWKAANIQAILNYQIELGTIQKVVPLVILLIMFIFKKFIGFKAITIIMWLINFFRQIGLRFINLFNNKKI